MDERVKRQVELIIDAESDRLRGRIGERVDTVTRRQAAAGMLKSGNTIALAVREIDSLAGSFAADVLAKVAAVACTLEAFETSSAAIGRELDGCSKWMTTVVNLAVSQPDLPENAATVRAAQDLFGKTRRSIEGKVAIARFDFERGSTDYASSSLPVTAQPRKGGRRPAEFWDDMWAAIGAALYVGDLKPKAQADIERAMADWIVARGHEAASSTIRDRAHRLWDLIRRD